MIAAEKKGIEQISFGSIVDDSYLGSVSEGMFSLVRLSIYERELTGLQSDLSIAAKKIKAGMDSGNDIRVTDIALAKRDYVVANFVPYTGNAEYESVFSAINNPEARFSDFEDSGLFYLFADKSYTTGIFDDLYGAESIFGRQFWFIARHSEIFRNLAKFGLNMIILDNKERNSPWVIENLYASKDGDSTAISAAVRYEVLALWVSGISRGGV
jgi:hypothetical protein